MSTVAFPHIAIRSDGHPITADSGYKVRLLVQEYLTGATPAELQEAHLRLSLSEIHAALSYYYDHQEEMDREIQDGEELIERMMAEAGESIVDKKLRTMSADELKALMERMTFPGDDSYIAQRLRELGRDLP